MRTVFRKFGLVCVTLAFFSLAGGHWALLQGVAWAQMAVDYSQRSGSMASGLKQTFDGQHPCELCREIQTARCKESKSGPATTPAKEAAKIKALSTGADLRIVELEASPVTFPVAAVPCHHSRMEQPPTPPPRAGQVAV